jgi:hypothetical protein
MVLSRERKGGRPKWLDVWIRFIFSEETGHESRGAWRDLLAPSLKESFFAELPRRNN